MPDRMDGDLALEQPLGRRRQRIVGGAQIGEFCVAAFVGNDVGIEHAERAGHGPERGVGVPEAVGQPVEPAPRIDLEHLAVAVEVGDVGDLGAFQAMLDAVMARPLGRGVERSEMARELDLLAVGEFLAAEHHDRVAVDRRHDGVAVGGL